MNTNAVVKAFLFALVLGASGDVLLREHPWGLSATIWFSALALSALWLMHPSARSLRRAGGLVGCAVVFALLVLWRDAWGIRALNVILCLSFISLAAATARGVKVFSAHPFALIQALIWNGVDSAIGPPVQAVRTAGSLSQLDSASVKLGQSYGRGLLVAVPIMGMFALLFASADPIFERYANALFPKEWDAFFEHAFVFGFYTWLSAGLLLLFAVAKRREYISARTEFSSNFAFIEANMVLGCVTAVTLSFVLIQIRYLFGGHAHVLEAEGLTVAEYARRGFFELSAVALLTMGLLFLLDAWLPKEKSRGRRAFSVLSSVLIGLVLVVIASALQRMNLYMDLFGLTALRVWVSVAILAMACLLLWQAAVILANRTEAFLGGALAIGVVFVVILQVINPDALTARVNVSRATQGHEFDAQYASRLSADAYPVLVESLPLLNPPDQNDLRLHLRDSAQTLSEQDIRSWNWSKAYSARVLGEEF